MKRYGAEFIGTFVLVFAGLGAALFEGTKIGWLGISFAFGFALLAMVVVIGPISGCHVNPAVTFGAAVARRIKWTDVPGYLIAQILGAASACGTLAAIFRTGVLTGAPDVHAWMAGVANGFGAHSLVQASAPAAFIVEAVLTFVLVFTVLGATEPNRSAGYAAGPIGLALAVTNLVAIPITNASINPARSFGPAIYAQGWALQQLWLFIAAPIVGGIIAAVLYGLIREKAAT